MDQPITPPSSPTNAFLENMRCIKCKDKTGNVNVKQIITEKIELELWLIVNNVVQLKQDLVQ